MALESSKEVKGSSPEIKTLYEGVSMTKEILMKIFAKHGLVAVSPDGQKFDPNLHEAIFEIPQEQVGLFFYFLTCLG